VPNLRARLEIQFGRLRVAAAIVAVAAAIVAVVVIFVCDAAVGLGKPESGTIDGRPGIDAASGQVFGANTESTLDKSSSLAATSPATWVLIRWSWASTAVRI
jgi:hypothetical protein